MGRSRGGWGSKICLIVDALGNPLGFTLTGAEQADIAPAQALIDKAPTLQTVIANKGYDSDALVEAIRARGAEALIPPRSNRKTRRDVNDARYSTRHRQCIDGGRFPRPMHRLSVAVLQNSRQQNASARQNGPTR